ncbi:MAG: MBL fold metallo-hydrolase [Kiritimatiellia bacterium]
MKVLFLGTGTSVGVPMIGCDCPVCTSCDPRNRRRRAAVYLTSGERDLVVDTPPDFREQALEYGIRHVDAVLITHSHADHIFGLDDIRRFNTIQNCAIPVYASLSATEDLRRVFDYVELDKVEGMYRPQLEFMEVSSSFCIGNIGVEPLPVNHGSKPTFGFLFSAEGRRFGYVPDCREMSEETVAKFRGIDVMVLDALRHRPHKTHLTLEASVKLLEEIGAGRSFITHMCHDLDHEETGKSLPGGISVSYDGLEIEV